MEAGTDQTPQGSYLVQMTHVFSLQWTEYYQMTSAFVLVLEKLFGIEMNINLSLSSHQLTIRIIASLEFLPQVLMLSKYPRSEQITHEKEPKSLENVDPREH